MINTYCKTRSLSTSRSLVTSDVKATGISQGNASFWDNDRFNIGLTPVAPLFILVLGLSFPTYTLRCTAHLRAVIGPCPCLASMHEI